MSKYRNTSDEVSQCVQLEKPLKSHDDSSQYVFTQSPNVFSDHFFSPSDGTSNTVQMGIDQK